MLPIVAGIEETKRQILIYSAILLPVGMLPWFVGFAGAFYAVTALAAGLIMLTLSFRLHRSSDAPGDHTAKRLFGFSILYVFLLFAVLLVEQGLGLTFGRLPW